MPVITRQVQRNVSRKQQQVSVGEDVEKRESFGGL